MFISLIRAIYFEWLFLLLCPFDDANPCSFQDEDFNSANDLFVDSQNIFSHDFSDICIWVTMLDERLGDKMQFGDAFYPFGIMI